MKNFSGYVLAGGKSSRMGADKFALEINGKTFLTRAVNALKPVCEKVKIVLNKTQTLETDVEIVRDIYENRGALGGVHAAFKNCQTKFAVVLAVDLPLINSNFIESLCKEISNTNSFAAIVPQQFDGRLQPLCAVYRIENCLPQIEKILSENKSVSMREFLKIIDTKITEAELFSENTNLFLNINNTLEFKRLLSQKIVD